jgi:hypothetical protein
MRLLVVAATLALFAGCAPRTHRANLHQLQYRAVFDLACHAAELGLYHVDARTKVVVGCGRRLVYQEDCARMGESVACTWRLDTPIAEQWTWPRPLSPTPQLASSGPADCSGRTIHTELFDVGNPQPPREAREIIREVPYQDPLPVPATGPSRGRTIFEELETRH